jgi:hypothetical protein
MRPPSRIGKPFVVMARVAATSAPEASYGRAVRTADPGYPVYRAEHDPSISLYSLFSYPHLVGLTSANRYENRYEAQPRENSQ